MSLFRFLNRKTKEDTRNTVNDIVPEKLFLTRATCFEVAIHCKHRSGKTQKLKKKILEHRSVAMITLDKASLLCSTFVSFALVFSYLDNNF